uniref:Uncharacterized protein n=1 Tax=Ralstonia solanacearum TaxID=305 RepID=A0A0S4UXS5_RALSL|nr:protein of unknown function [Ralstonia solanacearum]
MSKTSHLLKVDVHHNSLRRHCMLVDAEEQTSVGIRYWMEWSDSSACRQISEASLLSTCSLVEVTISVAISTSNRLPANPHQSKKRGRERSRDGQRDMGGERPETGRKRRNTGDHARETDTQNCANTGLPDTKKPSREWLGFWDMVERRRIELPTFALRTRRSPS